MSEPTDKPTIEELFAKISPTRGEPTKATKVGMMHRDGLFGRRKAYAFAVCFVKNGFRIDAAYQEFLAQRGKKWNRNCRYVAGHYANSKWVAHYVRELVQKATERVTTDFGNDLDTMLELNRNLINGDILNLVEQVREYTPPVFDKDGNPRGGDSWRLVTRMRSVGELTKAERLLVKKINFYPTGEIRSLEAYDRLDAQRVQIELLEIVNARGGSDTDWMSEFRSRITSARKATIANEVARVGSNVVKLGAVK